jgi:hypothetical protein
VKAAIHATGAPQKFEECANPPFYALAHQDGKSRYVRGRYECYMGVETEVCVGRCCSAVVVSGNAYGICSVVDLWVFLVNVYGRRGSAVTGAY